MTTRILFVYVALLGLGPSGCDDDSGDDPMTGTEGAGVEDDDSGDEDSGESNDSAGGGGSCEQDSPQGDFCDEGDDCTVACLCADGVVNSGRCTNGSCADPIQTCEDACGDFEAGEFSGAYCALGDASGDDGGQGDDSGDGDTTDAGACVPTGDVCEINGDCCGFDSGSSLCTAFSDGFVGCADVCFFDSDCVSDCCVPLDSGASVCAASSECG